MNKFCHRVISLLLFGVLLPFYSTMTITFGGLAMWYAMFVVLLSYYAENYTKWEEMKNGMDRS